MKDSEAAAAPAARALTARGEATRQRILDAATLARVRRGKAAASAETAAGVGAAPLARPSPKPPVFKSERPLNRGWSL